jgi:hypothetical protein
MRCFCPNPRLGEMGGSADESKYREGILVNGGFRGNGWEGVLPCPTEGGGPSHITIASAKLLRKLGSFKQ